MPETETNNQTPEDAPKWQPGAVIAPGTQTPQTPQTPPVPAPQPAAVTPAPAPAPVAAPAPVPAAPKPVVSTPEPTEPVFSTNSADAITWTASEFVAHEKSTGWYVRLAGASAIIAAIIFLLTRDLISTGVVIVAAALFGVLAARKPHQVEYRLDGQGVTIGQKHVDYAAFRSFSIVPEGAFASVVFVPLKRFSTLTTIYYAPEDEDRIIDLLADRLPFEERGLDAFDRFLHRIRF